VFYKHFFLFHGEMKVLFNNQRDNFERILEDFTKNFENYYFVADFRRNLLWNLNFQGFFYSPIEQKAFLETQLAVNSLLSQNEVEIKHVALFYEEYFVSSTLSHTETLPLYQYLVGFADCQKDFRKDKVFSYKSFGHSYSLSQQGIQI